MYASLFPPMGMLSIHTSGAMPQAEYWCRHRPWTMSTLHQSVRGHLALWRLSHGQIYVTTITGNIKAACIKRKLVLPFLATTTSSITSSTTTRGSHWSVLLIYSYVIWMNGIVQSAVFEVWLFLYSITVSPTNVSWSPENSFWNWILLQIEGRLLYECFIIKSKIFMKWKKVFLSFDGNFEISYPQEK